MAESEKVYLYLTTPIDASERKFSLLQLEGSEQISGLFHYRLTLSSSDENIDSTKLLGKQVSVTIESYNGNKRQVNGIVNRLIQADSDNLHTTYFMELVPWFWLLSQTSDCRIFQNQKIPDILATVFNDFDDASFDDRTSAAYPETVYCVQYRESCFDFACRLMEESGIFYFFEHADGKHKLILADDKSAHSDCPGIQAATLTKSNKENDESISHCALQTQMTANQFASTDYNFETPDVDLSGTTPAPQGAALKVYDYPGRFSKTADGTAIDKLRLQASQLPQKLLTGTGQCRAFVSGYSFTLKGHERSDMNTSYVLKSLSITAGQSGYQNSFEAFPADAIFRPPIITPKPRIHGSQTALVVGKAGEEIWTDKYGRIKVQFYWDALGEKNEKSSCWIRVAQAWAGKGWGTLFTPRMDAEVIISFLEGDPDRPIVTGTVYNASQTVPYALPDKQTTSTILTRSSKDGSAGNELRFDDTKDAEELYFHAQKDMNVLIENARTETLNEGDETLTIKKGNRTETINEGNDSLTIDKGDRSVEVSKGKETHSVKSTREVTVTDNETHTNKADFTQKVTGNYSLTIDGTLDIKVTGNITINGQQNITSKAGMNIENEAGVSMTNKASASMTNDGGGMMENKAGIIKLN